MEILRIYNSEDLLKILAERSATLLRLADGLRLRVSAQDDKTPAAALLFGGGNTCVQVEAAN